MTAFELVPHEEFPNAAIDSITVNASRGVGGRVDLEYCVRGLVADVRWPDWKAVEPADRLWEHTCFELFVRSPGAQAYAELNFTTSGQWAAYRFDHYRAGMRAIDDVLVGGGRTVAEREVRVRRTVSLPDWADPSEWQVGLSAVIEMLDGSRSWWALVHPEGPPDFHNDICFAGRLEAPRPA